MGEVSETLVDSRAREGAEPALSVLIPFHGDDPRPLLHRLDLQARGLGGAVELIVLNDGDPDERLSAAVAAQIKALRSPARLIRLSANEGRAMGRNRLVRHARAPHLLFLDSDMCPDSPRFLARWLEAARQGAAVAFGGFTVDSAPACPSTAVHRAMARRSDCLPAAVRRRTPEKYVFTSNLLVRRDVIEKEAFDEGFRGWGWEDVEWAMRVSRRWRIEHVDNTATHLGLDTVEALARKYEQSAANFARIRAAHPEIVASYPSFRVARAMRFAPFRSAWRPALRTLSRMPAPLPLRALALRLYRAGLYAEVV
ncbi:MAG TPA: glycosyltransferase family A protein [Caulobacteraceae bacterium]|jgi:glycosyltransferase involved in cell wall biosynthesis